MSIDLLWRWKTFVSQLSRKRVEHAARLRRAEHLRARKRKLILGVEGLEARLMLFGSHILAKETRFTRT